MKKVQLLIGSICLVLLLAACSSPTEASPGELETENFGWVSCYQIFPQPKTIRCLGLEYGDGFGHSRSHFERKAVIELQGWLEGRGFNPGPHDGYFGRRTRSAVYAYQRSVNLKVDGYVGSCTWSALFTDGLYRCPPYPN